MTRGRVAAVGTVRQIRELLDDHPLTVRIDTDRPRDIGKLLFDLDDVLAVDLESRPGSVLVRTRNPKRFFADFQRLTLEERLDVSHLETIDESTHAVLGYLLGGSGRT